jgi:SAM-dependent methyltransferase
MGECQRVIAAVDRENLWGYQKRLRFVRAVLREAFPARVPNDLRVLDVGCGNGSELALPLSRDGFGMVAIDTDERSIAHAKELARDTPTACFQNISIEELTETGFDAVILSEVLEHVNRPRELLKCAVDHVTTAGIVIVTTPNGYGEFEWDSWLFRLLRGQTLINLLAKNSPPALGATDNDASGHIQFFTRRQLHGIFAACGLAVWREEPASLFAGPIAGHTLARSRRFVDWNARVTDSLPLAMASGWYFALRPLNAGAAR